MSIWDMFKTKPADPAGTTPAPVVDASKTNATVPGASTTKSDGSVAAFPKPGEGDKSPLSGYEDLWQASKDKDGKIIPVDQPSTAVSFNIDPKKMFETARGIDFRKAVAPELWDKATKGDATALADVVNSVAQAAYAQSAVASTKILETALQKQAETFRDKVMPDILRKHSISTTLRADNPLFENVAVAPMLNLVEQQFATKFPTAAPAEISQKAREYLSGFATELLTHAGKVVTDKPAAQTGGNQKREPTDWGAYFGVDSAAA